jgi:hypothetical protein
VDPVPDPLLLRKSGTAGNRTRTSVSVARNSDHKTTEAVTSNIISVIKWRRWMGHVSHMREMRNAYVIFVGRLEGRNSLEDLGIDRWIILKWISKK